MFRKSALEPPECLLFFVKRDIDCRDGWSRHVSFLAFPHELIENLSRLIWSTHADVSDGQPSAGEMPDALGFSIKLDRLRKVSIFPVGSRKIRIQIEIVRVELQRSLALCNGIVDSIVSQIRGGCDV